MALVRDHQHEALIVSPTAIVDLILLSLASCPEIAAEERLLTVDTGNKNNWEFSDIPNDTV